MSSETTWDPWSRENNDFIYTCLRAAKLAGVGIENGIFEYENVIAMVDNAENLDLLGGLSRELAILAMGLWLGRYAGNQEAGNWAPRDWTGTDVDNLRERCEEILQEIDNPASKEFVISFTQLKTAVDNIHPENLV